MAAHPARVTRLGEGGDKSLLDERGKRAILYAKRGGELQVDLCW